jgi:hypothetical protein
MAINGKICIFRVTSSGQTETLVTDKIEFDDDHLVPDAKSFMLSMRPTMAAIQTDNTNPGSQNPIRAQDTGNAPLIITLSGYFDEKSGNALGIATFRNWMRTAKVIKTLFPKGRFGLRNNVRDEFDLAPSTTAGYRIISFELDERYEYLGLVPFTVQLRFDGDYSALGA